MSAGTGGGGNAKLRRIIENLESNLDQATQAYVEVCITVWDLAAAGMGLPEGEEFDIPEDGDVVKMVREYVQGLKEGKVA